MQVKVSFRVHQDDLVPVLDFLAFLPVLVSRQHFKVYTLRAFRYELHLVAAAVNEGGAFFCSKEV